MAFNGKYQLESQENRDEFLKAIGIVKPQTDEYIEVVQNEDHFKWTQYNKTWNWSAEFTIGQECTMKSLTGQDFDAEVMLRDGILSADFPEYHFSAKFIDDNKLLHICVIPGEDVTCRRIFKRI